MTTSIIDYGYGLSLFLERKQLKGRKTAVKVGIISAAHRFRFTGGWLRVIFQAERSHWSTSPGKLLRACERSWQDEHLPPHESWIFMMELGSIMCSFRDLASQDTYLSRIRTLLLQWLHVLGRFHMRRVD
jgi:hypothetical protein